MGPLEKQPAPDKRQILRWIVIVVGAAVAAVIVSGLLAGLLETIWLRLGQGQSQELEPE